MDNTKYRNNKNNDLKLIRLILITLKKVAETLKMWIAKVNKNREGKYSSTFISLCSAILSAMLLIIMLFVPPYLGMSDDGSFARVSNPAGIYHLDSADEDLYFNYYVKEYLSLSPKAPSDVSFSAQRLLIHIAKFIDNLFTQDNLFDLRFLALIYGLLFIPAIALLIKQATQRAKTFAQSIVIALFGIIIFVDVSYITYFSSFYNKPIMYIGILFCVGAAFSLQEDRHNPIYLIVFTSFGMLVTTAENQCAVVGIFLGILCVKFIFISKDVFWRLGCICCVLLLFASVMFSVYYVPTTYTQTSKYHAMTRGVLLQATDPEQTLQEFGIDSSYAVLTDTSSYDNYPFVKPDNKLLEKGFYDRYSENEIFYYYLKKPKAMIAMLDISVKSALDFRAGYSGNYEKSVGMPKMAKSLFWSIWSNFKTNSAPRTIGFIIVLLIAILFLFRNKSIKSSIPLETMLIVFCIGISQAIITIVNSGDAEMSQHLFLLSVSIDILIYFCFSQVLNRLNII